MKIAQMVQKESRFSNFRYIKYQRDEQIAFVYLADI